METLTLSKSLDQNIASFQAIFQNDNTFIVRIAENAAKTLRCGIFFFDGMVESSIINENIIRPITRYDGPPLRTAEQVAYSILQTDECNINPAIQDMLQAFLYGDAIVLCDGSDTPIVVNTKGFSVRKMDEPDNEKVIRGSREGFGEGFMANLSMIRRRLRTTDLKFSFLTLGTESNTTACICYLDSLCDKKVLAELKTRLDKFVLDGVLDSNYIAECISDHPYSPFSTIGITERPDIAAAKLLEGRVALILDGTPVVLTMPHIFQESFQTNDDYYLNFLHANVNRVLRIFGFFLTISIPALYVALMTYHQELIPSKLLISIAGARQGVPFPTLVETFGLLIVFEVLKEAGTRTPGSFGQTLSIVGALILGEAAVNSHFISAPLVIVIAFSGTTALMVPKLQTATTILRFFLLFMASVLGLYGYIIGIALILMHLSALRSFSIPFMTNILSANARSKEDVFLRYPWFLMKRKGRFIASKKRGGS